MMDFEVMGGIGWRDIVLVIAAVIGVYLLVSVGRLFRVGGKRGPAPGASLAPGETPPSPAVSAEPIPEFAEELARSNVEGELERLRRDSAQLREEMARLGEEVARLKATRNVSPLYNEAMTLAQQGLSPAGIAGRCGISIGEAELVAALVRGGSEFERHEPGEDCDERNTDSGNRPPG